MIDFVTAFGRLLGDGALREEFARDPESIIQRLGLRECDRPVLRQLRPADLEYQARVLLKKRFDLVRFRLPQTCRALGDAAWTEFVRYGRVCAQAREDVLSDAAAFGEHLMSVRSEALCRREWNRCRFALGQRRVALYFILREGGDRRFQPAVQIFLRRGSTHWHEWQVYLGW